jgi:hypothetical protein
MTPQQIEEISRQRYNAVNDTFWSQAEIFNYIYLACLELADEDYSVERLYTSSTIVGTADYDFPSNAIAVKRVTWNGRKLTKIDMIEDDVLTGLNQETTATGNPEYYYIWNQTFYLRPVPASVATLKIWTYNQPSMIVSATQDLEVPSQFHGRITNAVLKHMSAKDSNPTMAQYYDAAWERDKFEIKKAVRKMKRADKFTTTKDEQMVVETYIGGS